MIDSAKLPIHVGLIMDGNGRWAKKRGLPRMLGHKAGASAFKEIARYANKIGIRYLTAYVLSTENWKRSREEVAELMRLLGNYMKESLKLSKRNNMRVRVIGDVTGLSQELQASIKRLEEASAGYTGLQLTIALNYGGRDEITRAVRKLIRQEAAQGVSLSELPAAITEEKIGSCLDTADLPEVDLLIRTSGEQRLSNFLLWELAYTEMYFTDVLWPDFSREDLEKAVAYYGTRNRRFGGVEEA